MVQQSTDNTIKAALLDHFHQLMVLVSTYKRSAFRCFHYRVLRSIELGLGIRGIPPTIFSSHSSRLLPFYRRLHQRPRNLQSGTAPAPSTPSFPCSQICDEWSWYDNCNSADCPKQDVCVVRKLSTTKLYSVPSGSSLPHSSQRSNP